jgi:hypothetical protein
MGSTDASLFKEKAWTKVNQLEISFGTPLRVVIQPPQPTIIQRLTVWHEGFEITVEGSFVMYTLAVDHFVQMQVSYVDAGGNPAKVDGPVVWSSSDTTLATAVVDTTDNTIVTVTPVGPVGQVQVTATADADLGAGVQNLITIADITLAAGTAIAGTITPLGAAQPKP